MSLVSRRRMVEFYSYHENLCASRICRQVAPQISSVIFRKNKNLWKMPGRSYPLCRNFNIKLKWANVQDVPWRHTTESTSVSPRILALYRINITSADQHLTCLIFFCYSLRSISSVTRFFHEIVFVETFIAK